MAARLHASCTFRCLHLEHPVLISSCSHPEHPVRDHVHISGDIHPASTGLHVYVFIIYTISTGAGCANVGGWPILSSSDNVISPHTHVRMHT